MIHRNTKRYHTMTFVPKFSDADIMRTVIRSRIWRAFFINQKDAVWEFLKGLFYFKSELFISPVRSLLRHSHGHRTMGYIITIMSMVMMAGFNSKSIWGVLINVFPFMAPLWVGMVDEDQYSTLIFENIQSQNLLYFWMGTTAVSLFHMIKIHVRKQADVSPIKRGDSWLYQGVFKHTKISEEWVQNLIEPMIICGVGAGLIYFKIDFVFGLFLVISGVCLFIQEMQDTILRTTM